MFFQQAFKDQSIGRIGDTGTDRQRHTQRINLHFSTTTKDQEYTADDRQSCGNEPIAPRSLTAKQVAENPSGDRRTADTDNRPDGDPGFGHPGKKTDLVKSCKCSGSDGDLDWPAT